MSKRYATVLTLTLGLGASVAVASRAGGESQAAQGQPSTTPQTVSGRTASPLVPLEESWLRWPLPAAEQVYADIDGQRLKGYVKEATAISRRSRDRGEQWWGRIQGMPADAETQQWLADRFRRAGVPDVRIQTLDLPPQWYPSSWSVTAVEGTRTLRLESAVPGMRTPSGTFDLEAVYVGLGTQADFAHRDVKGKAVFVYGSPQPGLWSSSAIRDGALQRAEKLGAAAVFLAVGLPGNLKMHAVRGSVAIPAYSLGLDDFVAVREMIERSAENAMPRIKVNLEAKAIPGLKTANVWGVIPGLTDEKVIVSAHRDGYFEAAGDNASGMATLIGLAEHYAKLPRDKRRRTVMLVGTPGHHGGPDVGFRWMAEHKDTELAKTALFINGEHTAAVATFFRGPAIRRANMTTGFWWSAEGSRRLQEIVMNAYRTFGVATFAEPESSPTAPLGVNGDFGDIPTASLVEAGVFYHTEGETDETIPPYGLEASTRAFAKMIDEVSKLEISALKKAATNTIR